MSTKLSMQDFLSCMLYAWCVSVLIPHNHYVLFTSVTAPTIEEYKEVIHACEGEQVTLKIKVLGFPKPTITWYNSGRVTEASYAIDIEQDGSLTFVSVEFKHSAVPTTSLQPMREEVWREPQS